MSPILPTDRHPPDCPAWDYEHHPQRHVVPQRVAGILTELVARALDTRTLVADTRVIHRRLFVGLTPDGYDYFAGHYRGEPFRCLQHYRVRVGGDPRVGIPPENVAYW